MIVNTVLTTSVFSSEHLQADVAPGDPTQNVKGLTDDVTFIIFSQQPHESK